MNTMKKNVIDSIYDNLIRIKESYANKDMYEAFDAYAFLHLGVSLMYWIYKTDRSSFNEIYKNNLKVLNENFPKWKKNKYTGGNTSSGSTRIGDFLIQYGTISTSGQVKFPVAYEYNVQSVIMQKQGASNYTPFPNDITNSGFYANSVDVNTQWIAFGRMWAE